MLITENIPLRDLTTFRMGGAARFFATVTSAADLTEVFVCAQKENVPVIILGGGSNIIVKDGSVLNTLVIKIEIKGFETVREDTDFVEIKIGAGENWDDVVRRTVEQGLSGIEAMSFIPGTAGATPIQNVGAYGQEIKDTFISLEAYEIATGEVKTFSKEDCRFAYRDSVFKQDLRGKYVITSITLRLSKSPAGMPQYPGVQNYFDEKGITNPTLAQIREAIIAIRTVKLPDPREIASVGSFFKNPICANTLVQTLREHYPEIPSFAVGDDTSKIPAGWLIDTLGWKGKDFGTLMLYPKNALVIVNKGGATFAELTDVVGQIKKAVNDRFGIMLEQEPIVIG